MAVDYISTLNSKGSGLNITQIVGALVDSEIVPQRERLNDQLAKEELSITALGSLRAELDGLRTTLATPGAGQAYEVASASEAIGIRLTDPAAARPFDSQIEVQALAAPQVLTFGGFPGPLARLPAGSLTVTLGGDPASAQSVTLASPADTLADLALALDDLDGVSATLLAVGDGTYSLMVKSDPGADSALQIVAGTPDLAALAWDGTSGTTALAVDGASVSIARAQPQAAADAVLVVDGVTLRRGQNTIEDLVPGATIELSETTDSAVRVVATERADIAQAELEVLVERLNATRTALEEATRRGVMGAEPGPLAGDPTAQMIVRQLAQITTQPLRGFGTEPHYLSEIGVMTNRDGSLSLDAETFQAAYARDPSVYRAVFESLARTDTPGISVLATGTAPPDGAFALDYTDATTATLDGEALIPRTLAAGDTGQEFYAASGRFAGLRLRLEGGAEGDATVFLGTSLLDRLSGYLDGVLSNSGEVAARETRMTTTLREIEDRLARLDEKAAAAEARHRERFTAMESLVTQIKASGEYMTALMDAWQAQKT